MKQILDDPGLTYLELEFLREWFRDTTAATIMIAERASDLIKGGRGSSALDGHDRA